MSRAEIPACHRPLRAADGMACGRARPDARAQPRPCRAHARRLAALCAAGLVVLADAVPAQVFPAKPLRLIVRAPPGGGDDLHARLLATPLAKALAQPVVLDYRPGAGGLVAWEITAKSQPDGYTLLLAASGLAGVRALRPEMPVDPWRDFAWVSQVATFPLILTANNALPARSLKDVVALARRRPGELNYGSSGIGATPHLAAEYFRGAAGIDINHVPFKGSSAMYLDLMAGRIELGTSVLGGAIPFVRSGRLRALAVTSATRSPQLPDVPTVAEALGLKDFEFTPFYAIVTQGQTPRDTVQVLSAAVGRAVANAELREGMLAAGSVPSASTPEQMLATARRAADQIERIVKATGIKGGD